MATGVISLALCLTALSIVQPSDCTLPESSSFSQLLPNFQQSMVSTWLFNFFHRASIYYYPLPGFQEVNTNLEDFLQPFIILWNPNITYHEVVKDVLQRCVTCGSPYTMMYWNDGSSAGREPRVIQSMNNIVYLVSAVYVCCYNHRMTP